MKFHDKQFYYIERIEALCQICSTIIIIRRSSPMLLSILIGIFLILQGVEGHLMKSTAPYQEQSHQENNVRVKDPKTLFKNIQNKHSLKHFTTGGKQNVIRYTTTWPRQNTLQKQPPNIPHQNIQAGVKEIIEVNDASKHQILQNSQDPIENYNIYENNKGFEPNKKDNSIENHKSQIEPSFVKDQVIEQVSKASLHQQSQSQFINHEEKTLYFKFFEAIDKLVNLFSTSKGSIQNEDTINGVESHLDQSKQDVMAKQIAYQIQSSNKTPKPLELPKEISPSSIKNFELQTNEKIINDTKMMAKTRKKLYFIICTLSFGATCIFLIKLLQGQQDKKIIYRKDQKIKIPTEDFYIQQI